MSGSGVVVRPATPGDTMAVARLVHGLLSELAPDAGVELETIEQSTSALISEPGLHGLLAFHSERPVGVLMLTESMAIYAGSRFGVITELYVEPGERSAGIASALIEAASNTARGLGWTRLEVTSAPPPKWQRTLDFYLREGFEVLGPRLRRLL